MAALEEVDRSACPACATILSRNGEQLIYDHFALLRELSPQRYRLYRALCNNGYVSYNELASGSVSLPNRPEVREFAAFLLRACDSPTWVLDVGCGPLSVPGYLEPLIPTGASFIGLDVYPTEFSGWRIAGCAEFLPLADQSIDIVVFATSLDHVCDLGRTFDEIVRVLKPKGRCCIWMSEREPYWRQFFMPEWNLGLLLRRLICTAPKRLINNLLKRRRPLYSITHHFTHGRYWEYENGSVFYCPPGAVDPFHSFFESPDEIIKLAQSHGLELVERKRSSNGVLLCLST